MHYVVIDLEWNQPLSHMSSAYRKVGDRLIFELIQIGAVKLDEKRRLVGSFSCLVTPEHYLKLHPRIRRITGITQEDLADAPRFLEALDEFVRWCGEDCVLLTWGSDDVSVFQQNLDFFKAEHKLPPFYDLQRLYVALLEDNKEKKGLQAALAHFGIVPTDEHPFHNAVDDAYYTALVFQRFPDAQAVLQYPQTPRALGRAKPTPREQAQAVTVRSERAFFSSAAAKSVPCPICGRKGEVSEGYVPQRGLPTALADCPDHGLYFVSVRFERDQDNKLIAHRMTALSDEQSPAYVKTKHLQWAQKVKNHQAQEDSA